MKIEIKETETKGFAQALEHEVIAGQMTYSIPSSDFIIIDHTEVNPAFKGREVGKHLLYKVVEMAREKKLKILPLCPFANKMFQKLTDIQDVLKQS
ncbi:MAG TPA: GNAT family N-acetyltransferase [Edaphocola sp.]|nr:GNAT family N-acetyltransferase [Edaphocola sp.]